MILDELKRVNQTWAKDNQPALIEAYISALGNDSEHYKIKLKNGAIALNVFGPTGLSVGDSVTVAVYPGKAKRYVILAKSYKSSDSVTTVSV